MANKFTDAAFKAKLSSTKKLVLMCMAHRTDNKTGRCWPSYKRIASDCGIGYQTAVDTVRDLLRIGVFTVVGLHENANGQDSNEYQFDLSRLDELASSEEFAFKSKCRPNARKSYNPHGSRTGTGDELVREPGLTGTATGKQPPREPGLTGTGAVLELFSELSRENSSENSAAAQNINIENPQTMDSILYSAEAENLAKLFVSLLKANPNVKFVPNNWLQTYPVAIQQLIDDYGDSSAIEKIIRFSQTTKWAKYIVRLETLVKKAQDIWNQILTMEHKQHQRELEQQVQPVEVSYLRQDEEKFVTTPAVEDDEDFG
jgi:hypothetical protein